MNINLSALNISPIQKCDEARYRELMAQHHYLGDLPKIGHTLWYVATYEQTWVALLSFSASALKCGVRDQWIGWDFRNQYGRLKLIANNSRFLILPGWHYPNLASKILAMSQKRIASDWQTYFSQPLLLLETFVDPARFHGTIYRASNWTCLGLTRGFRRTTDGYSKQSTSKKLIFVYPLKPNARLHLSAPILNPLYQTGALNMTISAKQMTILPDLFSDIPDPRRTQGRRHPLRAVLGISAGAVLCGMNGYKANEDRDRIRTGYGPENITRLRRFAVTVIAHVAGKKESVAELMRRLQRNTRLVFDYLRMTQNSAAAH